jgi:hypothetical protein
MTPSDLLAGIEPAAWQYVHKDGTELSVTEQASKIRAQSNNWSERGLYTAEQVYASLAPLLERLEKAEAERDEAVAALEPFAREAAGFEAHEGANKVADYYMPDLKITIDDFRRAAALTATGKTQEGENPG